MHKNSQFVSSRRAAAQARSQIAAWTKLQDTTDTSDEDDDEPTPKLPRHSFPKITKVRGSDRDQSPEWYIAIDFGTTFTTVAWCRRGTPSEQIHTVDNFPGTTDLHLSNKQIPTELWYHRKNVRLFGNVKANDVRVRFGSEVHRMANAEDGIELRDFYDDEDRVVMMKLLLDKTDYVKASRERLQKTVESIKAKKHIENDEDVFFHFFQEVLRAVKIRLGHDFKDDSTVEVTFCVPVCYKSSAVAILGAQLERAMKDTRFGTDGDSPCNIFVVHEAEAQAMRALKESLNELERGETFILIDCGGGTTDIGIYRIALTEPLRLGTEVHEATGAMVGATGLNDKVRSLVRIILRGERYLETGGDTIDGIIATEVMPKFENDIKRDFRYENTAAEYPIRVRGLKRSAVDDRVRKNYLVLKYQDIWNIFRPAVKKIGDMMQEAVMNAKKAGYTVSKVVVVGGFGDSPCLQSYLLEQKDRIVRATGSPLKLRFSPRNMSATGVATGAIMRAMNKADGPSRMPCQSIGILRHIPCDQEEEYPAEIMLQQREWSAEEQVDYVMNTIEWLVKKDDKLLGSVHTVTFESEHVFKPQDNDWVIEEQLWASESCTLDFYRLDHPNNAGKTMEIGAVEFDVSDMREQIRKANMDDGENVDKVVILVEMTVIDRNLEFTARWPATPDGSVIKGSRKFFSVASAFVPGTQ